MLDICPTVSVRSRHRTASEIDLLGRRWDADARSSRRSATQRCTTARGSNHVDKRQTPTPNWRLPVMVLVVVLLGGCARSSATCVGKTWNLRTPPSRADVDMAPGKAWVSWQCDDPQEMTFELPADIVFSLPSTLVTFDAYGARHPETSDPTGADVHTGSLRLDVAAETANELLTKLGADTREIAQWQQRASASSDTDTVKSPFIRSRVDYLGVEVQTAFSPLSNSARVHVIFSISH